MEEASLQLHEGEDPPLKPKEVEEETHLASVEKATEEQPREDPPLKPTKEIEEESQLASVEKAVKEEPLLASQLRVEKTGEEQFWKIDRALIVIENELGKDLFKGKYGDAEVCIRCLKELDHDRIRDFRKLCHENVIQIIGICTKPLNHMVVFEPVCRSIHDDLYKDQIIFDPPTLMKLALDVANGVQYLLENRMDVDLKPSNLLINKDGVLKLFGYGLLLRNDWSMYDNVQTYGILLWELITREDPLKYVLEQSRNNFGEEPLEEKSLQPQPVPRNYGSILLKKVFDSLSKRIAKETSNQKLVEIIDMCFSPEPPFFAQIIKLLMPVSTDTSESYKKPPGFYRYR